MPSLKITELPTEVFESYILPYLNEDDVKNIRRMRNRRLKEIAASYLRENKSKSIICQTIIFPFQ